ncbi:MAG: TonB-dependent receptor, partial [Bacteroidia bacterium]|nr:TonB-dependent receptor [Bacteroidia bacterium]
QYFQLSTDINMWYVYFSNRIVPDYSHADKIIYSNLNKNDYSINRGVSVQLQINYHNHLQSILSLSFFDNYVVQSHVKKRIMLSEPWSANWIIRWMKNKIRLEYTGSIYGSMILPKAGALDPRPDKSPVYSIQNMQATYSFKKTDITIGVKNILNFTPNKNIPFLISRAHDPFDKKVQW